MLVALNVQFDFRLRVMGMQHIDNAGGLIVGLWLTESFTSYELCHVLCSFGLGIVSFNLLLLLVFCMFHI